MIQALPPKSGVRLHVVTGVPAGFDQQVLKKLNGAFDERLSKFIVTSAAKSIDRVYTEKYVEAVLRATAGFAVHRRRGKVLPTSEIVPGRLILISLDAPNVERLLEVFDFCAWHESVGAPPNVLPEAGDWRFNVDYVVERVTRIVQTLIDDQLPPLEISSRSPKTLPPMNFQVSRDRTIKDEFIDVRCGKQSWNELEEKIKPHVFTGETFPAKVDGMGKKRFFVDHRSLVFPPANDGEEHAIPRRINEAAPIAEIRRLLNGMYRFGTALRYGFHHDTQFADRKMKNETFHCGEQGAVVVSGQHINIYPNDFLRGHGISKLD